MLRNFGLNQIKRIISTSTGLPTGDKYIDDRYELHNTKFGHHWPYYRVFYQLAKLSLPTISDNGIQLQGSIVELGGWQGTAAAHFASGNPEATVITIDHHGDPGDEEHRTLMLDAANRYPNLKYLQGWTWDKLDEVKELSPIGIDILFVDSWHDYEHAMRDWNDYKNLLASPALIICDDIISGYGPVISGMEDFWYDIMRDCNQEGFLDTNIHPGSAMGFLKWHG